MKRLDSSSASSDPSDSMFTRSIGKPTAFRLIFETKKKTFVSGVAIKYRTLYIFAFCFFLWGNREFEIKNTITLSGQSGISVYISTKAKASIRSSEENSDPTRRFGSKTLLSGE